MNTMINYLKYAFLFFCFFLSSSLMDAQELKIGKKMRGYSSDTGIHEATYSYFVDDLGYFTKYHGWQIDNYNKKDEYDNQSSIYKVYYEDGKPKCFTLEANVQCDKRGEEIKGTVTSSGTFDADGISALQVQEKGWYKYSHSYPYIIDRQLKIAKQNLDSGTRLYFDVHLVKYEDEPYTTRDKKSYPTIGYFTQNGGYFVYSYSRRHRFIYMPSTIIEFGGNRLMDEFIKLDCNSIEQLEQLGFTISSDTGEHMYYDSDFGIERSCFLESWMNFHLSDVTFALRYPPEGYDKLPDSCCIETKFGNGSYDMVNLQYRFNKEEIKSFFIVSKGPLKAIPGDNIEYLTDEQYEKYKDRLVYDCSTQRHCVKKADGSYLYVPDKIEETIIKTDAEKKKDAEELIKKEQKRKQLEYLLDIHKQVKDLQQTIDNLPDIKIPE